MSGGADLGWSLGSGSMNSARLVAVVDAAIRTCGPASDSGTTWTEDCSVELEMRHGDAIC